MAKRFTESIEDIVQKYHKLRSSRKVAAFYGVSSTTIDRRLQDAGIFRYRNRRENRFAPGEASKYTEWRKAIMTADGYRCQVCGDRENLVPHHIFTWAKYPERRYDIANGVTLCTLCHNLTMKREDEYEQIFLDIIEVNRDINPPYVAAKGKPDTRPETLVCADCGVDKPLSEYYKNKGNRWGVCKACKECQTTRVSTSYHSHREQRKAKQAEWYLANKEHRQFYLSKRAFNTAILEGRVPRWTPLRARLGIVTAKKSEWPTPEVLAKVRAAEQ
jgi:5-methylcytosine-specific restriction endonuclease McrA